MPCIRGSPPRVWGRLREHDDAGRTVGFTPTCVGTARRMAYRASRLWVHPHVCGDGSVRSGGLPSGRGSPPRVWGRLCASFDPFSVPGFTPTCGDGFQRASKKGFIWGSPPRVWGRPDRVDHFHDHPGFTPTCVGTAVRRFGNAYCYGFTPTCVGTATTEPFPHLLFGVHPHVCGDGSTYQLSRVSVPGSPPRVWGRRGVNTAGIDLSGFTPTCVGTACGQATTRRQSWVHPHLCGDGSWFAAINPARSGSPPRVWGRLRRMGPRPVGTGFTPTCVGTAHFRDAISRQYRVHPHVCGDGTNLVDNVEASLGSPPRVWGRLAKRMIQCGDTGFTPTCVGTARSPLRHRRAIWVHPHVCGDGGYPGLVKLAVQGSPPRVWGRLVW